MCDTRALISSQQSSDLHSCWIIYTRNDGQERLTVTDTKPVIITSSSAGGFNTTTDLTNNNNNNSGNGNNNNNNNNSSSSGNGINNEINTNGLDSHAPIANDPSDPDADVDPGCGYTEQSLADILDPDLQPEPPIRNNAESQAIYREHRHMAKEFLSVDTNLYYAQDFKEKLILQMDRFERDQKQEILRKIKDKEGLQSLYNNLKQQWEKLPAARQANQHASLQPPALGNNSSPHGGVSQELTGGGGGGGGGGGDAMENDGWVMIPPHHNA